jgi:hypothetical protein
MGGQKLIKSFIVNNLFKYSSQILETTNIYLFISFVYLKGGWKYIKIHFKYIKSIHHYDKSMVVLI